MPASAPSRAAARRAPSAEPVLQANLFPSKLGWMAIAGVGVRLDQLTFGHASPDAALAGLEGAAASAARVGEWNARLAKRLQAYAAGGLDDFRDVALDLDRYTAFQRRVIQRCRRIAFGATMTYGELAAAAGSPLAARAVGNCMARNPTPLVVPCHRVVGAGGGLGGYSACDGVRTKLRLLEQEAQGA